MIELRDKETGASLGSISPEELRFLMDQLEEESDDDTDYYLNRATFEMLKDHGASARLRELLERAFGDRDEIEFEWSGQ
jgi:processive 1,2-diacylglycerol beta-glucosyltransferase